MATSEYINSGVPARGIWSERDPAILISYSFYINASFQTGPLFRQTTFLCARGKQQRVNGQQIYRLATKTSSGPGMSLRFNLAYTPRPKELVNMALKRDPGNSEAVMYIFHFGLSPNSFSPFRELFEQILYKMTTYIW